VLPRNISNDTFFRYSFHCINVQFFAICCVVIFCLMPMAFDRWEIKGLLTYLLTYLLYWRHNYVIILVCACVQCLWWVLTRRRVMIVASAYGWSQRWRSAVFTSSHQVTGWESSIHRHILYNYIQTAFCFLNFCNSSILCRRRLFSG